MDKFEKITTQLHDIYVKKNSDYGSSFDSLYDTFGITSAVIRLSDKVNRLISLTKPNSKQQVKDESIDDTLMDLANYAILTLIKRQKDNEPKETPSILDLCKPLSKEKLQEINDSFEETKIKPQIKDDGRSQLIKNYLDNEHSNNQGSTLPKPIVDSFNDNQQYKQNDLVASTRSIIERTLNEDKLSEEERALLEKDLDALNEKANSYKKQIVDTVSKNEKIADTLKEDIPPTTKRVSGIAIEESNILLETGVSNYTEDEVREEAYKICFDVSFNPARAWLVNNGIMNFYHLPYSITKDEVYNFDECYEKCPRIILAVYAKYEFEINDALGTGNKSDS